MNASTTLLVIAIACAGIGWRSAWMIGVLGGYAAGHRACGRTEPSNWNNVRVFIETVGFLTAAAATLGCGVVGVMLAIGGGA